MWRRLMPGRPAGPWPDRPWQDAPRVVVLEQGHNPSGDYLLLPWLARGGGPVVRLDARQPPWPGALQADDFVVVVRYLGPAWRRLVERHRAGLAGLAWFLDDDLLDPAALAELPADYARKLSTLALAHRPWFEAMATQWWLATEALGRKYAALQPTVLPLRPPPELRTARPDTVRVVYHGSASHGRELVWLHAVLSRVQASSDRIQIELIGDLAVNRRFRDLPRVSVLHPMGWANYLAHTRSQRADIGLAPLLPGAFNAGRGAVKFFDYGRMGAFGLYSDVPPYAGFVRHDTDGLLLPNEPDVWAQALLALAAAPQRRAALSAAVAARLAQG